jgi:hypothetical protein
MFADLGGRSGGMDFQCRSRQRTDPRTGVDPTDLHESNGGQRRGQTPRKPPRPVQSPDA